jgi:hypothetical protein
MTDFDPDDYDPQSAQDQNPRNNFRRQLEADKRAAEDRAAAAEARVAELERNHIFSEVGVPDDAYFRKGYDGEMTADAVRAAYQRETGVADEASRQASLEGHRQAQAMSAGASSASPSTKDADWAALQASVFSKRRNGMGFGENRAELARLAARDIEEVMTPDWKHPRQLAQR